MEKARALAEFVNWAITDGQQFASPLHYVPLPESVVQHNQQTLKSLTFNGQPGTSIGMREANAPQSPFFSFQPRYLKGFLR